MGESYLVTRLSALRSLQNPDGGWGYFPNKRSWLEPTAYAALALHGDPAAEQAWSLLRSWQANDGSWRPSADVQMSHWDTALCVTLAAARGEFGEPFRKGVGWLLNSVGVESGLMNRIAARVGLLDAERNLSLEGWPWKPGTSSWVEPTAHTLVALKKAAAKFQNPELGNRVRMGEAQLLDVRCVDGGWNYGNRTVLEVALPSYPETTALALVGLQGHAGMDEPLKVAGRMLRGAPSPMARAWLNIALRLHGQEVPEPPDEPPASDRLVTRDILVTTLEALGSVRRKLYVALDRIQGWSGRMKIKRRDFFPLAGAAMMAGYAGYSGYQSKKARPPRLAGPSPVAVVKASSYSDDLVSRMLEGIRQCGLDVRGKSVLLKPNLVEFDSATCINTNVAVTAAALEVFKTLGASQVLIGEGPGHRRDTYALAEMARYRSDISKFDAQFVDLNRDDVSPIKNFADRAQIYLPNTALRADLVVSLPKMKTHHWAGATLSMKNFFGLVPGSVYGWPKNELHFVGIDRSIVELNRIFRRSFAIVDGIVGMEGNGPIQGTPKPVGVLVMGSDLPAVDATCCRIMGIDPHRLEYLRNAGDTLGIIDESRIEQRGEAIRTVHTDFKLIKQFHDYRLA